jgi:ABC-type nitrate/sulfonate/bicarbonate transport system permease component
MLGGTVTVAALLCWQWYSRLSPENVFVASSPQRAGHALWSMVADPGFWSVEIRASALGFALGWALAIGAGLLFGALMGFSRVVRDTLQPLFVAVNCVPRLAVIPLATMWLGYGLTYKTVVVAFAGFFPVLLNTTDGVRTADPRLMQMSRSFCASRSQQLFTVAVPASLPMVFAGLRQSLAHSVTGILGAEIWASSAGIGWVIANAELDLRTDRIIAAIVVVTLAGVLLNEVLHRVEARFTRWHRGGLR